MCSDNKIISMVGKGPDVAGLGFCCQVACGLKDVKVSGVEFAREFA